MKTRYLVLFPPVDQSFLNDRYSYVVLSFILYLATLPSKAHLSGKKTQILITL